MKKMNDALHTCVGTLLITGAIAAALMPAAPARSSTDDKFTITGGCFFYEKLIDPKTFPHLTSGWTWSGQCQPGEPISGRGTVRHLHQGEEKRDTGLFVNGYKHGEFNYWSSVTKDSAKIVFNMGCMSAFPGCVPGRGAAPETPTARRATPSPGSSAVPSSSSSAPSYSSAESSQAARQEGPVSSGSVHNPANDGTNCVRVISEPEMKALGIRAGTTKGFLNRCAFPVLVVYCYVGGDCNPGYSNLTTAIGPGSFYPLAGGGRAGTVAYAACRAGPGYGFGKGNQVLIREMKHVCN